MKEFLGFEDFTVDVEDGFVIIGQLNSNGEREAIAIPVNLWQEVNKSVRTMIKGQGDAA